MTHSNARRLNWGVVCTLSFCLIVLRCDSTVLGLNWSLAAICTVLQSFADHLENLQLPVGKRGHGSESSDRPIARDRRRLLVIWGLR